MKTISLSIATLAFVAAGAVHAAEATRFEAPTTWSNTRVEVQAEAQRAAAADELDHGEAGARFGDPAAPRIDAIASGTTLRVMVDNGLGDRNMAGAFAVGGM